jgi:hypothetical protein
MATSLRQSKKNKHMTTEELYTQVLKDLPIKEIHPLHKAIMEECCETALENPDKLNDLDSLVLAVRMAFVTCNSILKGTLQGSLKSFDANQITLNYRNQTFIIPYNSPLLKDEQN